MNTENNSLNQQQSIHQKPPRSSNLPKPLTLLTIVFVTAFAAGTGGYLLGTGNSQLAHQNRAPANSPQSTVSGSPPSSASPNQQASGIAPSVRLTPQPIGPLIIKSQSFSHDKEMKVILKAPREVIYGSSQEVVISDASGAREILVLSQDFVGAKFAEFNIENWSPDSKYVYVYTSFIEGGDLYVFKATGEAFSNGERYLRASMLGYPQLPLSPTWVTNTQIQIIAYQQGPIVTNKTFTYIFDVEKESVTQRN